MPTYENYSVLMSVYKNDKPEYLIEAINSMLNQTVSPEQIVIVLDGPIGKDLEIAINNFIKNTKLFTIVKLEKNGGLGNALNHGLLECRNDLVARMDADDISLPNRCENQLKRFSENKELQILGTQIEEFIDSPDNIVSARIVPCSFNDIKVFARRRSPFNHPTVMYRKTTILKLGGYVPYGRKEDLELFIRAVNSNCLSENLDEKLLLYRTSDDNLKRRKTWKNCSEYIEIMWNGYKKGYCGISDLIYVIFGQFFMFILPTNCAKKLSNRYLRENVS